jgi:effector-binding domain-containing protein
MAEAFFTLAERLAVAGVTDHGPVFSLYRSKDGGDLAPYVAVEMGNRELVAEDVTNIVLSSTKVVATVIDYAGGLSHAAVGPIYGELARWAEDHGYEVTEPGRDILVSFEDGVIMEHQLPVKADRD